MQRMCACADWSLCLLLACQEVIVSRDKTHMIILYKYNILERVKVKKASLEI